jgi:hypothetical protein
MLHCGYCRASIFGVCAMNDVVEDILNTYQSMRPLDAERAADSRQRISRYIENLASAGQRDAEQLTISTLVSFWSPLTSKNEKDAAHFHARRLPLLITSYGPVVSIPSPDGRRDRTCGHQKPREKTIPFLRGFD